MSEKRNQALMSFVILFLLGTTLFNTLRANKVAINSTNFRKEASYQLRIVRENLDQQKVINASLQRQIDALTAVQETDVATQ